MNTIYNSFPNVRLSRLRQNSVLRDMLATPIPSPDKFIYPVFICEGTNIKNEIKSMPNQYIYSVDMLLKNIHSIIKQGITSFLLFGTADDSLKTPDGRYGFSEKGAVQSALRKITAEFPELNLYTDVCMCAYTDHGHCGILNNNGTINNDASLGILQKIAVSHIEAGAVGVAPSAMMDGQIKALREAFKHNNFHNQLIISYSTKFASSMYGPFRDAASSSPKSGDRKSYQLDYRDWRLPLRESIEDEKEGADILMVKPSMMYLDIISKLREKTLLPIASYNVSGEYSMLIASAQNGWGDLKAMVRESIIAQSRAGSDIFISYWANQYNEFLRNN